MDFCSIMCVDSDESLGISGFASTNVAFSPTFPAPTGSIFPSSFRNASNQVDLYFEAASLITVLVILGQVLELKARIKTASRDFRDFFVIVISYLSFQFG